MTSRTLLVSLAVLVCPALALAQPAPPPPPEGPPPAPAPPPGPAPAPAPAPSAAPMAMPMPPPPALEATGGPPQEGWQLQARLPTNFGVDSLISPGFTIGRRVGKIVIGAEVGLTGGKLSTDNGAGSTSSESVLLLQIVPMIYDDIWQSIDGRARLDLVAGIGYGRGSVTNESNDGMGNTTSTDSTATILPIILGVGGDYYLHRNFAIGVEFGADIPVLLSVQSDGMDQHLSGALESARGLIRFTFVTGN